MNENFFSEIAAKLGFKQLTKASSIGLVAILLVVIVFFVFIIGGFSKGSALQIETNATPTDSTLNTSEGEQKTATSTIFVHVSGAVQNAGLVELEEGARVANAIQASGGFSENADSASINLARVVLDGEQIHISELGERSQPLTQNENTGVANTTSVSPVDQNLSSKVNINTADVAALVTLPGIGESTAAKIIFDRETNGPFLNTSDITRVSGIGEKKYEALADLICI